MKVITLSEEKLNELAQAAAERMMEGRYFNQGMIRGEELKNFSSNSQVNKFLLFQVYQVWNMQLSKLKHPYFDFEHPEIQESLNVLRNQLSRNIAIKSQDFGVMLKRAIYNNLKLLTDPKEAFTSFFFVNSDSTSIELFERYTPFFADLDFVVNSILHYHKKHDLETVGKEAFFEKMDRVIELYDSKSQESFESYCAARVEALTGKTRDQLTQESEAEIVARQAEEVRARQAEEVRKREEEAQKQEEEAARRRLEEAERRAVEERLRLEAEARRKAEEEKERQAAELRRKEEELKRLEEERRRLEEERKRMEEEKQKLSFFDTIQGANTFFDIEAEEIGDTSPPPPPTAPEPPVIEKTPEPEVVIEAAPEIQIQTPVAHIPQPPREPVVQDRPDTIAERLAAAKLNEEKTVFERLKAKAEAQEEKNEPKVQAPKAEEKPIVESPETSKESTASFLDRFLNNKKAATETPEAPPVAPTAPPVKKEPAPSILDSKQDRERPQTVAEKFQQQSPPPPQLHDNLNGINGKIKLDEIPIHKQYQYVQKVFDGNNVRFRIIVDKINNARSKEEVEDILDKFVLNSDSLDRGDGVVKEFLSLLRNRF